MDLLGFAPTLKGAQEGVFPRLFVFSITDISWFCPSSKGSQEGGFSRLFVLLFYGRGKTINLDFQY
jgi:hypothetical protein